MILKLRINVILLDAGVLGGIQIMTMDTIGILLQNGYEVHFYTSRLSQNVAKYLGRYVGKPKVINLPHYQNVTAQMLRYYFMKIKDGISINMHGDIQPIMTDAVYFHQFNVDYRIRSPIRERLKILPQYALRKSFINKLKKERKTVLVNSSWTKAEAKYFWNLEAKILYPPVHLEVKKELPRENSVITVSRFSRDRGLERVLTLAREMKDVKFILAGHVQDESYFKELSEKKGENIHIYPNVDEETKTELLARSKVYLNPTPYIEGLGVSVIEGMNAGLIPVTRNVGGVIDFVPSEFMFNDYNEMREKVELALRSWSKDSEQEMRKRVSRFSPLNYEDNLIKLIDELM